MEGGGGLKLAFTTIDAEVLVGRVGLEHDLVSELSSSGEQHLQWLEQYSDSSPSPSAIGPYVKSSKLRLMPPDFVSNKCCIVSTASFCSISPLFRTRKLRLSGDPWPLPRNVASAI